MEDKAEVALKVAVILVAFALGVMAGAVGGGEVGYAHGILYQHRADHPTPEKP